jgi:glycosyltransferase involved in cell wall biosynthesis
MTDHPTISVIIPVYNGERFLAEALQSVLDQILPPGEIIVVDDGSTDDSAAVVARCAAQSRLPIRYVFQQNAGPAAARNRGLALACGEIIAFQDADDLWTEGRLAIQVGLLARHPAVHAVIGRTRFIYEDTAPAEFAAMADATVSPHWFLGIHSGLYRRSAFEVVGPFNAALRYHEDIDWFRRARAAGLIILPHDDAVLLHRRHAANMTNDRAALRREFLRMLRQSPRGHAATTESLLAWLTGGAANHLAEEPTHAHE